MADTSEPEARRHPQAGGSPDPTDRGLLTEDIAEDVPGTNVTGSDTPGSGGTQPLEFTEDGRPVPPGTANRPGDREG